MGREKMYLLTAISMKEASEREKDMGLAYITIQMVIDFKAHLLMG